jgi:hypothetical protein
LMKAPSQPWNPSRRSFSDAKVPVTSSTLPNASSCWARAEEVSLVRTRQVYFLSWTRPRMTGMPCAPVPPTTKILEVLYCDIVTKEVGGKSYQASDGARSKHWHATSFTVSQLVRNRRCCWQALWMWNANDKWFLRSLAFSVVTAVGFIVYRETIKCFASSRSLCRISIQGCNRPDQCR